MKALAICQHENLDAALATSLFTWGLAFAIMLCRAGSFERLLEEDLTWLHLTIVAPPLLVFLLVYFGGSILRGRTLWFDRVCVNEVDPFSKIQTLQSIPAFVASSKQMLVLFDSTFLERLWCNYEVAIFAKTRPLGAMSLIPTWMPLWGLVCFALACLQVILTCLYHGRGTTFKFDSRSRVDLFLSVFTFNAGYAIPIGLSFLPFAFFCFWKQKDHLTMLQQMSQFDIRNAKCTLETDRVVIERHVLALFDEAFEAPTSVSFGVEDKVEEQADLEDLLISPETMDAIRGVTSYPTKDEILDEFNQYVRGSLRDSVVEHLGSQVDIPLKLCLVGILPLVLSLPFYACEGYSCKTFASELGTTFTTPLIFLNGGLNVIFVPSIYIWSLLLQLRVSTLLSSGGSMQICMVLLLTIVLQSANFVFVTVIVATGVVVAAKYSPSWLAGLLVLLGMAGRLEQVLILGCCAC